MTAKTMNRPLERPFEAETIYNGKVLKREHYYTESQWMEHVERHARKIVKRYIRRKAKVFKRFLKDKTISFLQIVIGAVLFLTACGMFGYIAEVIAELL